MTTPAEQPLPVPSDRPAIQDLVIADIRTRKQVGIERYGTPLQAHNGRDALRDLYEELLDATQYVRQVIEERADPPKALVAEYHRARRLYHEARTDEPMRTSTMHHWHGYSLALAKAAELFGVASGDLVPLHETESQ